MLELLRESERGRRAANTLVVDLPPSLPLSLSCCAVACTTLLRAERARAIITQSRDSLIYKHTHRQILTKMNERKTGWSTRPSGGRGTRGIYATPCLRNARVNTRAGSGSEHAATRQCHGPHCLSSLTQPGMILVLFAPSASRRIIIIARERRYSVALSACRPPRHGDRVRTTFTRLVRCVTGRRLDKHKHA